MRIEKYLNKEEIDDICVDVESFIFLRIKEERKILQKQLHLDYLPQEFVSELVNDILRKLYFQEE